MFDRDSRSVVRSLIGLFAFRSNPVSKVYQHRSRNDGILEVTWSMGSLRERTVKDTAVGELTPDPFPQLANGTGPNRTRAQWKFTNIYHQHVYHTGQCKRTGGCYNELVVAFYSTGGGVKGKKIYTC